MTLDEITEITFKIPGKPVPAVRTTRRQKHYSKQYQRYEAYKVIVQISYFLAYTDLTLPSMVGRQRTKTISEKVSMTRYRDTLLEMIGTAKGAQSSYTIVKLSKA
jgi:hypothetical protein